MSKLDLDSLGEIVDKFLWDNEVKMLLTLPEGSLVPEVWDSIGFGSVVQFYILLNSIEPICTAMRNDMGIDGKSPEWESVVDELLAMVKSEMLELAESMTNEN